MLEDKLATINLLGKDYPYRCDMVVLEKIQKEFGDILKYEFGIRGLVPYFEEDTGKRNKKKDIYTVPNVEMVCRSLSWMIEEGIAIANSDLQPLTEVDLKRQEDLNINDLALFAFEEYSRCFLSKLGKTKKSSRATSRSNSKTKK